MRNNAALQILYYYQEIYRTGTYENRVEMAIRVACCYNRGETISGNWRPGSVCGFSIPRGKQGCFQNARTRLNGEGVKLAVREYRSAGGHKQ